LRFTALLAYRVGPMQDPYVYSVHK